MKKIVFIYCLIFGFILRGSTQSSKVVITKNFKFENGIYNTFAEWQHNKPTWKWDSVETNLTVNPTTFLMQMDALKFKKTCQNAPIDSIWGVVVDGIPYIRLPKNTISKPTHCFAGLILRGAISYFQFETTAEKQVPMTAYFPQTGEPYMTKNVQNKIPIIKEKLLSFDTGEMIDCTLNNFKKWIVRDKDLITTVNQLKEADIQEKLFKCILIYNDRNPVFVK